MTVGAIDPALAGAIEQAAREVWEGRFDAYFPLPVWQTGSGTQTNMNANEVIANRADELLGQPSGTRSPVHPNDHFNRSQSSNDSFPTMMHVAVLQEVVGHLRPALAILRVGVAGKAREFAGIVKIGRTHMMDAVPMTVGQGFDTFAWQIGATIGRLDAAIPRLGVVPQGGTAIGTGLNAPPGFDAAFCTELSRLSGQAYSPAPSRFEAMAAHDELVSLSGILNVLAVSLIKIANDLHLLGSGPRCGAGGADPAAGRADVVHHAGQDEPDCRRSHVAGRVPSDRQSRDNHRRRGVRQLRAELGQTGDRLQPAAIDRPDGRDSGTLRGADDRRHRGQRSAAR